MRKNYPEHEKLIAIQDQSEICSEFLDFLQSEYNMINKRERFEHSYIPFNYSSYVDKDKLLAQFFNIDMQKIEKEKRQMIDEISQ